MTNTSMKPDVAFAEIRRMNLDDGDITAALRRVAELAKQTLGAADISFTLVRAPGAGKTAAQQAYTVASTGDLALYMDAMQYQHGHGPCLEVAQSSGIILVTDMAAETRWPEFADRALHTGVHCSLSVALPVQRAELGALNIYGTQPGCFDRRTAELAWAFAGYAAVAIANGHQHETAATLAGSMQRAMETRAVIEQAKGIIIAQEHCGPEHAFERLTKLSHETRRKLRDCATDLVRHNTGLPTGPPSPLV